MLLPLVTAALIALSRSSAAFAASEDSLRCAPGERRIEIATAAAAAALSGGRRPPFVGEHLQYSARFKKLLDIPVGGGGEMRTVGRDTVRGQVVWKSLFIIDAGVPKAHFHDTTASWFDSVTFNSLRFVQKVHDPGYHADRDTQIFPDERTYRKDGETHPSVADALDDMSFVYLVRTLPLEPGQCYVLNRYFKPESNPVVVHVIRRDTVTVPAGRFPSILLKPQIKTTGIFGQNGHAELWLADDSTRMIVQLNTSLRVGSISLRLSQIGREK